MRILRAATRAAMLLILTAIALHAQAQNFIAVATTTALTVQASTAATGRPILGQVGLVSCTTSQTYTVSWNGTNATTTAGTVLKLPGTSANATATVFTASNASGGTSGPAVPFPANTPIIIDLSRFILGGGGGTGQNFTITASGGTCIISAQWSEQQ